MAEGPGRQRLRPVWAEIDLGAVRHNVGLLRALAGPAGLCAVVKADGYGHGAPAVARAALEAGAESLAVALVEEGVVLREAGIEAPILLLSEPPPAAMAEAVARRLTPTVYSPEGVAAVAAAAGEDGPPVPVHLKVDTGMHRVGADPADLPALARAVESSPRLHLAALWTHLAVADGPGAEDRAFTADQLGRLEEARAGLVAAGIEVPLVHAANSAGAIAHPAARLGLVRCGIALYGVLPAPGFAPLVAEASGGGELRPVLSWKARVSHVRRLPAGARPSYGRPLPLAGETLVATVPVGYADGVPRQFFTGGGTVLVGGRRRPLAGTVTMDQILVDCGPEGPVEVGDEVVLIGRQGEGVLTAWDWAESLGTIGYEVLCGIGTRVPRVLRDGGKEEGSGG
jgi:alanine racemase